MSRRKEGREPHMKQRDNEREAEKEREKEREKALSAREGGRERRAAANFR